MLISRLFSLLGLISAFAASAPLHAQCTDVRLAASDAAPSDQFGHSISSDGNWVAISAPARFEPGFSRGAVYLFERVGGALVERQKLQRPPAGGGESFGYSVSLDGDRLAVGAPGAAGQGRAYLYQRQGATWTFVETVVGSTTGAQDEFGQAVALDGDVLVVGAPFSNWFSFQFRGGAFVFRETGGTWIEEAELLPDPAHGSGRMGFEVAVEGDRLVVSAPYATVGGFHTAGLQRVFDRVGGSWLHSADLVTNDPEVFDEVGRGGVALSGGTVAAAAWLASSYGGGSFCCSPGHVYVFDESGGSWSQTAKLEADDAVDEAFFGRGVSLEGDRLLIGAYRDPEFGTDAGALYVFQRSGGQWTQDRKLFAADGFAGDLFGTAVELDGDEAFGFSYFTTPGYDSPGTVLRLDLTTTPAVLARPGCYGDEACPCGNLDAFGGCANSTGRGAQLRACGSTSVSADDLALNLDRAPANQFGLLFMGGGQPDRVFGDGRTCVGSGGVGLWRFPIRNTGPEGGFVETGLVAYSQANFGGSGVIGAGATWHFQAWFRDPTGPVCDPNPRWTPGPWHVDPLPVPKGYNLSNALSVTFQP